MASPATLLDEPLGISLAEYARLAPRLLASGRVAVRPIAALSGELALISRLRELGFIPGELVEVLGSAPFGEPLLVEIRGATIALRLVEARCVCL